MMPKTDPFSVRLTPELYDRLMAVIQATGGEITKSEIIERSINTFLKLLELEPTMITTYDPDAHKSVTQKKAV